jgi:Cu-Zn family superoxide dismutase
MKHALRLAACALLLSACATMEKEGPSATAVMRPASGSQAHGQVTFTQVGSRVRVSGEIAALTPGLHGIHIHEKGDCSAADAMSTGGHFNPTGMKHGGPGAAIHHAGDLGNIKADEYGKTTVSVMADGIAVIKGQPGSIIGRGLIVHAGPDDEKTDPTGNSGGRISCGAIE